MTITTAYIGIDVAKTFHKVCIKNQQKRTLVPIFEIEDTPEGFESLRHTLDALKERHDITLFAAGIESTSTYHLHIQDWLRQQIDIMVSLINPVQTNHYFKSDMRRASTDAVSAELIAQYMVERTPTATQFVPAEYETVKQLTHHLHGLIKQKTATINRLREQVALQWPSLERNFHNFNAKQLLAFLCVVQTPAQLQTSSLESLKHVTVLGTTYTLRSDFLTSIATINSPSPTKLPSVQTAPIIRSLAEEVLFLLRQIDRLTEDLKNTFSKISSSEPPLLSTISGVGDISAIFITAAIGDPNRFSSTKQISSYFGLTPRVKVSGTSVHGYGYIQKKGNSLVRYYLFNCVLGMIRKHNNPIGRFYQVLVKKGKPKLVAITACMRKLIVIMLAMLKSHSTFQFREMTTSC